MRLRKSIRRSNILCELGPDRRDNSSCAQSSLVLAQSHPSEKRINALLGPKVRRGAPHIFLVSHRNHPAGAANLNAKALPSQTFAEALDELRMIFLVLTWSDGSCEMLRDRDLFTNIKRNEI